MSHDLQVIVAGGGPAGATAALVLARRGRRVLLAGGVAGDGLRIGEAIPPSVRPLLRDIGVLDRFLADNHLPCYGNVSVWGSDEPVTTDFIFDPNGHGWHVDRGQFDTMLLDAARDAGVEVLSTARLVRAVRNGNGWKATLTTNKRSYEELSCSWLIDATGRRACIAHQQGVKQLHEDRLLAFFAPFRSAANHIRDQDTRTFIEAVPEGWWYTVLVPSGERMVAFLTDIDLVNHATMLSVEGFLTLLRESRYISDLLIAYSYQFDGRLRGTDAGSARLDCFGDTGWLAVGDAALAFDPLSSQGVLNALYTGIKAGQALDSYLSGYREPLQVYLHQLNEIYAAYRRNREVYYAQERRWRDHPFWHRRTVGQGIKTI